MPNDSRLSLLPMSRRALLMTAGTAAAAACFGVTAAQAQQNGDLGCSAVIPQKSPKDLARHVSHNNSYRSCGNCRFFQSPDQCVVVEGQTSLESSCSLWAQRGGQIGCRPDQAIRL